MKRFCTSILFWIGVSFAALAQPSKTTTWEVTYLKALPGQKESLIQFLSRNWFAMDSIAVSQGLMSGYKLWESANSSDWDVVVAVAYPDSKGYEGIKEAFEKIRSQHVTVPIEGKKLPQLGKIVKSEKFYERVHRYP